MYGLCTQMNGAKWLHEQEEIDCLKKPDPSKHSYFEDLLYTPLQKNRLIHLPLEGEKSLIRRLPVNIPIPQNWRIWIYGILSVYNYLRSSGLPQPLGEKKKHN